MRRVFGTLVAGLAVASLCLPSVVGASGALAIKDQVAFSVSRSLPLLRITSSAPISAQHLPVITTKPALKTSWQQIGPNRVQAVVTSQVTPGTQYQVSVPQSISCSSSCTFTGMKTVSLGAPVNYYWESQLLAELGYLPVSFTPSTTGGSPSDEAVGTFTWLYPALANYLEPQWNPDTDNVVLKGALMNFQSVAGLPTSGSIDAATWSALVTAVNSGTKDPSTYNYVHVSETYPETLTLYEAGAVSFTTLVNTGIPEAPTSLGTYPVYLRLTSQTMSGTNPDGTHYSDPGIPWISYFHGGEALHGFIRAEYGFQQSLGCVEMPFTSAKTVWPHTPIGTLVTVAA